MFLRAHQFEEKRQTMRRKETTKNQKNWSNETRGVVDRGEKKQKVFKKEKEESMKRCLFSLWLTKTFHDLLF